MDEKDSPKFKIWEKVLIYGNIYTTITSIIYRTSRFVTLLWIEIHSFYQYATHYDDCVDEDEIRPLTTGEMNNYFL